MLCTCSGEQFKFDEPPQSPESLATRDFSASGLSSRTGGDWDSKLDDDAQVDEVESSLREALSLNYEEARALLGRLEYKKGNYDAALHVLQGIDIQGLSSRMTRAIFERVRQRRPRNRAVNNIPTGLMSIQSVSLLLEAILLKARSLEGLALYTEAAKECKTILDIVDPALPNGLPEGGAEDSKLKEILHKALELLPELWTSAGSIKEAIVAYRRALTKPWHLDPEKLASIQKKLALNLLYSGVETIQQEGALRTVENNTEETILLLLILMRKVSLGEIKWDEDIMDHLTYALSITGQYELLAEHFELVLPGVYDRVDRWYSLALCYASAGQNETALNLLKKVSGPSEAKHGPHMHSFLLGAKLCSEDNDPGYALDGIKFARGVVNSDNSKMKHFSAQAHKLLGNCYGRAARISISDSERVRFQKEALRSLNEAVLEGKEDAGIMYSLGLENAVQGNLSVAFDSMMACSDLVDGKWVKCWKLISLIVSAERRLSDAKQIVDIAVDEFERFDQLELLRIKALLEIADEEPLLAIETYKILLSLIQARKDIRAKSLDQVKEKDLHKLEVQEERNLEVMSWQDLATVYAKLESWPDAQSCLDKAKSVDFNSPRNWHTSGLLYEAQSLYNEALTSFSLALSLEPDYVPSMVSTAEVLMKLGTCSLPIARSFLMSALRLEPANHQAWWNLGLIAKKEGSLQQAAEFFQAAYELKSTAPVQSFI